LKQICQACKSSYYFDDSRIPDEGLSYKCPRCGNSVIFQKIFSRKDAVMDESVRDTYPRKSFLELLPGVFTSPLRGNGMILLIAGTLVFGIIDFFQRYNIIPFVGIIVALFISGYLCAFLMRIINHSADGEEEIPDFPDFTDWWDSVFTPSWLMSGPIIFCCIPVLAYLFLARPSHPFTDPIILLLSGAGLFYLPMGIIAVSMTQSLSSLNPVFILPAIIKVIDHYIIAFAVVAIIVIFNPIANRHVFASIPIIGDFLNAFVNLYLIIIEGRILGLIYYVNRDRLNWFGERG
jgi:predicted Zn finger-like uncharacterized protein